MRPMGEYRRRKKHVALSGDRCVGKYEKEHRQKWLDKEKGHGRRARTFRDFLRKKTSRPSDDEEDED